MPLPNSPNPHEWNTVFFRRISLNPIEPSRTKFILHRIAVTLRGHPVQPLCGRGGSGGPVLTPVLEGERQQSLCFCSRFNLGTFFY